MNAIGVVSSRLRIRSSSNSLTSNVARTKLKAISPSCVFSVSQCVSGRGVFSISRDSICLSRSHQVSNMLHSSLVKRMFTTPAEESFQMLLVEKKSNGIGLITLNRPKQLNALCQQLLKELNMALHKMEKDDEVGCVVITGSTKAFAAGADIKEMSSKTFQETFQQNMFAETDLITNQIRKPIIAAVNGYALGGGCELAMLCDMIIAGENAKFGQPEITLATIPGIGGTQRLTRVIGKSKAMEMILTGRQMSAKEAESAGLVARVVPEDKLIESAMETAAKIASFSRPVVSMAKECVNKAYETNLREGVLFERRIFHSTFALNDQKEGMKAFVNKAIPKWTHS